MRRPNNRKSREISQSPPRPIIRVLVEGEKTEHQYVNILKREYRNIRIELDRGDTGLSAVSLLQRAREYKRRNTRRTPDFDEIWIIFDVDDIPDSTINQVIQEARDSGIKTAISNPCLELWLVLHYKDQNGYIERRKIQKEARNLGIIDQNKHIVTATSQILIEKYHDAKTRAKWLEDKHTGDGSKQWENPSSHVWKFVEFLRQSR